MATNTTGSRTGGFAALVAFLRAAHEPEYLAATASDLRVFTRLALVVPALFVISTVTWDYAIDPVHAHQAVWLRMVECVAVLLWAAASWRRPNSLLGRCAALVVPLVVGSHVHTHTWWPPCN